MREGKIHPAVLIKVEGDHAYCRRQIFFAEIDTREWLEFSLTGIEVDGSSLPASGDDEVYGAVVVEIRGNDASACGRKI
jgi:hypothetical protein